MSYIDFVNTSSTCLVVTSQMVKTEDEICRICLLNILEQTINLKGKFITSNSYKKMHLPISIEKKNHKHTERQGQFETKSR